jgi:hypothetical protein
MEVQPVDAKETPLEMEEVDPDPEPELKTLHPPAGVVTMVAGPPSRQRARTVPLVPSSVPPAPLVLPLEVQRETFKKVFLSEFYDEMARHQLYIRLSPLSSRPLGVPLISLVILLPMHLDAGRPWARHVANLVFSQWHRDQGGRNRVVDYEVDMLFNMPPDKIRVTVVSEYRIL